jgi:hypothetical protein
MSTRDPASRAAELAAQQVEAIVVAAQEAALEIEHEAERELDEERAKLEAEYASRRQALEEEVAKLREAAQAEADKERREAHEQAVREREGALAEAKRLRDEASAEAAERVSAAEKAADEALADARAISSGLRRLGQSLEEYAERILRDVQAGHKRLRADLRITTAGPSSPGESVRRGAAAAPEPEAGERPARSSRRQNPFDDIDLPSWVARDE